MRRAAISDIRDRATALDAFDGRNHALRIRACARAGGGDGFAMDALAIESVFAVNYHLSAIHWLQICWL